MPDRVFGLRPQPRRCPPQLPTVGSSLTSRLSHGPDDVVSPHAIQVLHHLEQRGAPHVLDLVAARWMCPLDHQGPGWPHLHVPGPRMGVLPGMGRPQSVPGNPVHHLEVLPVVDHPIRGPLLHVPAQQEVQGDPGRPSEQQLIRAVSRTPVHRGVVGVEEVGQVLWPAALPLRGERPQEVVERPVKPLTLPVALRVVGRGPALLDPIEGTQLPQQFTLEIAPLIAMQALGDPHLVKPPFDQDPGHRGRLLVPGGKRLCVLREHICHHQHLLEPVPGPLQQGEI